MNLWRENNFLRIICVRLTTLFLSPSTNSSGSYTWILLQSLGKDFFCKLKLPFQYFKLSSLVRGLSLKHEVLGNWKTQGSKEERERKRVSGIPRDNIGQGRRCPSKPTFPVFPCTLFPHIFPRGNFFQRSGKWPNASYIKSLTYFTEK